MENRKRRPSDRRESEYLAPASNSTLQRASITSLEGQASSHKILVTTGEKSTVHGFPSIASSKAFLANKILWGLSLLGAWAYGIYGVYGMVVLYTKYEKTTTISQISEVPTIFPAVAICSINPYDGSVSRESMEWIMQEKNISTSNSDTAIAFTYSAGNQFKANFEDQAANGTLDIYYAGFYITQIIIGCQYQGKRCGPEDFYWFHDYYYGNCFRFNGGETVNQANNDYNFTGYDSKKASKTGWRNGLQLELFAGSPDTQQQYTPKIGFRVIVHNQSIIPFPDEDGIDVPTGYQANVAISRTFMRRLPEPFSNCITEITEKDSAKNDIFKEMYLQKQKGKIFQYQANYCQKICYQYFIIEQCSCYTLSLNFMDLEKTRNENTTGCLSFDEVKCFEKADKEFYNGDESKKCYDLCPNECNQVSYKLSSSMARYPSPWYFDYYGQIFQYTHSSNYLSAWDFYETHDVEKSRSSAVVVNIFYQSLTYQVFEEKAKLTLDMAVSGMGGNIAFFTGMSILSIVEFMELIISCLIVLVVYKIFKCKKKETRSLADTKRKKGFGFSSR